MPGADVVPGKLGHEPVLVHDAVGIPELHWVSARHGRQAIGAALEESVRAGELSSAEATQLGTMILSGNAKRLYGLK